MIAEAHQSHFQLPWETSGSQREKEARAVGAVCLAESGWGKMNENVEACFPGLFQNVRKLAL